MAGEAHRSDAIMGEARRSLATQRAGGTHRAAGGSLGERSRELKAQHRKDKIGRIILAVFGILLAASVAGIVLGGIGFIGVMMTALALVVAIAVLAGWPKMEVPRRADLNKGDVKQMVGRTEIWLEAQRPALPAPAIDVIDRLGVQLDGLSEQLETVDANHPAARDIRKLVGEHLPETVDAYRKIPPNIRRESNAGDSDSTPDEQVTESLSRISEEIDSVSRQLAEGSLDDLAIRHRFLGMRYGAEDGAPALEAPQQGLAR